MTNMIRWRSIILMGLMAGTCGMFPAASVTTEPLPFGAGLSHDIESPEVAEPVTFTIEINYDPAQIRILNVEWDWGDFERMSRPPSPVSSDLPADRKLYTQKIPARSWEIDEASFGPVTIDYEDKGERKQFIIEPITLSVKSLIEGDDAALGDIRTPMIVPPPPYALYAAIAGAALLAIAAVALIIFWLIRRPGHTPERGGRPLGPPDLEALAAIDALMERGLLEKGGFKEFFTRLSDIVRDYLHRRFGLMAHELTTRELLIAVDLTPALVNAAQSSEFRAMLESIFTLSDLVKFAKHRPDAVAVTAAVEQAREFIVLTRPRPAAEIAPDHNSTIAGTA